MTEKKWREMPVTELIAEAKTIGITFAVEGDRLRVRGPKKAVVLGRFLLERKEEVLAVLSFLEPQTAETSPCSEASAALLPPEVADSAPWDDRRAAALVAEVDTQIAAALLTDLVADKLARQNVLANERQIVRRLMSRRDLFLWEWPKALWRLLGRWKERDAQQGR
jgi:hypothetical protein